MNYIVLDLEWNQGEYSKEQGEKSLNFEIIEIGAIKLSSEKKMISEFSELIKPSVHKQLHFVARKLVHLQMEQLETGKPFAEVMNRFLDWCGDDYIFCTWGPTDLTELQRNMKYYDMEPLFNGPARFLDVQKLYSLAYEDGKERSSLETAVNMLEIEKDIPFHRAFGDAYYTAKVFCEIKDAELEKKVSFDLFNLPQRREEEIHIVFSDYAKYITREFQDKTEAIADREVISTKCYLCHRNLKKTIKWFTPNGRHYYSAAYCNVHGYVKYKVRIKKSESGKVYVVKTSKFISEEGMQRIQQRRDAAMLIKKSKKKKKNDAQNG